MGLLVGHYPGGKRGSRLKAALFGRDSERWWGLPEWELLAAVVSAQRSIWDVGALDLERRLQQEVREGHGVEIAAIRPTSGPKPIRAALVEALRLEGDIPTIHAVVSVDAALAADVVAARPDVAGNPSFWDGLTYHEAVSVLRVISLSRDVLAAAVDAKQTDAVVTAAPASLAMPVLFAAGKTEHLTRVVEVATPEEVDAALAADDRLRIALWGSRSAESGIADVVEALERLRGQVSDDWLRAATRVLAEDAARSASDWHALETVFGPTHRAITENRLPDQCWDVTAAM